MAWLDKWVPDLRGGGEDSSLCPRRSCGARENSTGPAQSRIRNTLSLLHTHTLRPVTAPVETDPADRLLMDICHKCLTPVALMRRRLVSIVDARPLTSHKQSKLTRNDAKSTWLSGKSPVWSNTQSMRKDGSAEIRVNPSEPGPIFKLALISPWTTARISSQSSAFCSYYLGKLKVVQFSTYESI